MPETPEQREAILTDSPRARVTVEDLRSRIASVSYLNPLGTLTLCLMQLDNGFIVTGQSACVEALDFRPEIGEAVAYDNALSKLWELIGFLRVEDRYRAGQDDVPV